MASGKVAQDQDVPIELYKALANPPGDKIQPLLELFNDCFRMSRIPEAWAQSRVAMVFKKANPNLCENYKPICLSRRLPLVRLAAKATPP